MLFERPDQETDTEKLAPQHHDNTGDWRRRVAELDGTPEDEATEEHIADAMHQLRKGGLQTNSALVATSSLSSLSTAPLSTPSRRHETSRTPPGGSMNAQKALETTEAMETADESNVLLQHPVSEPPGDQPSHPTPEKSPLNLFDDDDTIALKAQKGGPKVSFRTLLDETDCQALSKAEQQQMHKDIAQAERGASFLFGHF